jgi:uncharacterized protein (TIGR00369 family)
MRHSAAASLLVDAANNADARVRDSFAKQTIMATLGASVSSVKRGEVEIVLPFSDRILQQHGFIHAGAIATIADSACGYAALSVMPNDAAVLTTEFKVHLLSPPRASASAPSARWCVLAGNLSLRWVRSSRMKVAHRSRLR